MKGVQAILFQLNFKTFSYVNKLTNAVWFSEW